jgi:hypothetical protein
MPAGQSQMRWIGFCSGLALLCSCASPDPVKPRRPPDTAINENAGQGDWLRVKLRMEDGKELSFMLDTGLPHTIVDKSLEPKLGGRLGWKHTWEPFMGGVLRVGSFRAPRLYLGDTLLMTDARVYTYDLQRQSPGLMGILGMDCLRNYCVQMDFAQRQLRFLDPDHPGDGDLGAAFPLTILFGVVIAHEPFFNLGKVYFCPDTGCGDVDVMLKSSLFRRAVKKQTPVFEGQYTTSSGKQKHAAGFERGVLGGQTYTNLLMVEWSGVWPDGDLIGLPFLARNLVTFNFPKRVMYLKQQRVAPSGPGVFLVLEAAKYLQELKEKGELPGWSKNDKGSMDAGGAASEKKYPVSYTLTVRKNGEAGEYGYIVVRETENGPWKLRKAFRKDAKGEVIKEFPVP